VFYEEHILGERRIKLAPDEVRALPFAGQSMTKDWWKTCEQADIKMAIQDARVAGGE
jgi:hypothetical protein